MTTATEQDRDARIMSMRMTNELHNQLSTYADDNSLSVSEAIREMMSAYADGDVPPAKRLRRTRRVSLWIDPKLWSRFRERTEREGVTFADALERAVKEAL